MVPARYYTAEKINIPMEITMQEKCPLENVGAEYNLLPTCNIWLF